MRKLLLMLLIVPNFLFAQNNTLDEDRIKKDWEQLVSYVGSQYFKSIVELHINDASAEEVAAYEKNIKELLEKSSLNNPVQIDKIDFSKWEKSENNWREYDKKRRGLSEEKRHFEELFDGIDKYVDVQKAKEKIRNEYLLNGIKINSCITKEAPDAISKVKDQISTIRNIVYPVLIALFVLLAVAFHWVYKRLIFFSNELKELERQVEKRKGSYPIGEEMKNKMKESGNALSSLESQIQDLQQRVEQLERVQQVGQMIDQNNPQECELVYLEYFGQDEFREASETRSFYCMDKSSKEFSFIESKLREALANSLFPMEICNSRGTKVGATHVKVISKGRVERQPNGRWKVVEKINLKFE